MVAEGSRAAGAGMWRWPGLGPGPGQVQTPVQALEQAVAGPREREQLLQHTVM